MVRKVGVACLIFVMALTLSGCATFGKKKNLEVQGLKDQVAALETQLQNKDQEISSLRSELERIENERQSFAQEKNIIEPKTRPNIKQIQTALRNAGSNP